MNRAILLECVKFTGLALNFQGFVTLSHMHLDIMAVPTEQSLVPSTTGNQPEASSEGKWEMFDVHERQNLLSET